MSTLHRTIMSLLLTFLVFPTLKAGDIKKIRGEAERFSPESESPEEALAKAIREAQIDALSKEFGVTVSERTLMIADTHDGSTKHTSRSYGESQVNGEWMRDLKGPEVIKESVEHGTMYYVKVYGEARELNQKIIDVDCRILCNGVDPVKNILRGDTFYYGDEMYVYFSSPVDGWLAIYLIDDDDQKTTQCLLPYDGQPVDAYPIQADKDYIFFSKPTAEPQFVDYATRMIMESRKKRDMNDLYVIFSPNKFTKISSTVHKALQDSDSEPDVELMPRESTFDRFDTWLYNQRKRDAELQALPFTFSINRK